MRSKKEKTSEVILVSGCLVGLKTRYDGGSALNKTVLKKLKGKAVIPICPEQLGGLSTPRLPAQISKGDGEDVLIGKAHVVDESGSNITKGLLRGTIEVLKVAELCGATRAILKEKSPSCGVRWIKRGSKKIRGSGVTAAALRSAGIKIEGAE